MISDFKICYGYFQEEEEYIVGYLIHKLKHYQMKLGKVYYLFIAIIEYLNFITNEKSGSLIKNNLLRKHVHPAVELKK
jgi:hypothetical protein